jgi:hypothetical protein
MTQVPFAQSRNGPQSLLTQHCVSGMQRTPHRFVPGQQADFGTHRVPHFLCVRRQHERRGMHRLPQRFCALLHAFGLAAANSPPPSQATNAPTPLPTMVRRELSLRVKESNR